MGLTWDLHGSYMGLTWEEEGLLKTQRREDAEINFEHGTHERNGIHQII